MAVSSRASVESAESARARGDFRKAEQCYREALAVERSMEALYGMGSLLLETGRRQAALPLLREALRVSESVAVMVALVACLAGLGRWTEARKAASAMLSSDARVPGEWLLAGRTLTQLQMDDYAEGALRRAIACGERSRLCFYGLGYVAHRQGRWSEAIGAYGQAMALNARDPGLLSNIAMCEQRLGRYGRAFAALECAVQLSPDDVSILSRLVENAAMRCAFDDERKYADKLERALLQAQPVGRPDPLVATYASISEAAKRSAIDLVVSKAVAEAKLRVPSEIRRPRQDARLRLGYLSTDFCNHAVGRLFAGYVGDHDRERVHVHAYSLRRAEDEVRRAISERTETVRDLDGQPSDAILDAIRSDGIDVLIDLNGYTFGGRPEVMAARPARRQLSYLGFVNDHRAPWLDGVVMDRVVAPSRLRAGFGNAVLDLPGTMFPPAFKTVSELSGTWSRDSIGVPDKAFLMCSFANAYKLDRRVLACWVEIARRVENGWFVIHAEGEARMAFERAWASLGGDQQRLKIVSRTSTSEFLAQLRGCDLMLDTFRYGGGATSVNAIMEGLPVLTLEGDGTVARMGASLNRFLGLEGLIASDEGDYISRAVAAADSRSALKSHMVDAVGRSGFRQGRRIATALEAFALGGSGT